MAARARPPFRFKRAVNVIVRVLALRFVVQEFNNFAKVYCVHVFVWKLLREQRVVCGILNNMFR